MTYRELYVRYTDGTGAVVDRRRAEDEEGHRELDRWAFDLMAQPEVESAKITLTEGTTQSGGRGRYR